MLGNDMRLSARSMSQPVFGWLCDTPMTGRVLSVFRRAWLAQFGGDRLVSIVAPELEDGPLNIVLEHAPSKWTNLQPGAQVTVQGDRLQCGRLEVSLDRAALWEPRPDWERLRTSAGTVLNRLEQLQRWARDHMPEDSMLLSVEDRKEAKASHLSAVQARAQTGAEALWAGWCGDEAQLGAGATQLAGLGVGLTPSGDDFLLGAMLCAWLVHPEPSRFCRPLLEASVSRTSTLSAALLRAAAQGECSAAWHGLFDALAGGSDSAVSAAAAAVISHGHTSGADGLAGFLWVGLYASAG